MRERILLTGMLLALSAAVIIGQSAVTTPAADLDTPYQQVLDQATGSEQAGDLAAALVQLETLLRLGGDQIPPMVRAQTIARIVALQSRIGPSEGPIGRLTARASSLALNKSAWLLTLFTGLVAVLAWRQHARRHPRTDSTAAFFDDLTRPADDRLEASLVLTRTILNQLQNPLPVRVENLEMDIMPGSEEPGFAGLQSSLNTAPIDGFKVADRPIKIAGFEFSVRDLTAAASRLLTRPHAANLTGWLSESGDDIVGYAELKDQVSPHRNRTWRIQCCGKDRRADAIANLSAQILVDTQNSFLTHNWKSLRAFREAAKLRQTPGRSRLAALTRAREYLEEAVTSDSSNWIARFNLALTLSRVGEPHVALKHFELLEGVVRRAWQSYQYPNEVCSNAPAFLEVRRHLEVHPECLFLILYNKAMTLAALVNDSTGRLDALCELERLSGLQKDDGWQAYPVPYSDIAKQLNPRARIELSLYALGAMTSLLATTERTGTHCWHRCHPENAARIEALLTKVESQCVSVVEQHWRSLQTTRAVTLAAAARAAAAVGNVPLARERLEASMAAEPRFLDAYLLLAALHIHARFATGRDWAHRAQSLLDRALELNPECARAHSLLEWLSKEGKSMDGSSVAAH